MTHKNNLLILLFLLTITLITTQNQTAQAAQAATLTVCASGCDHTTIRAAVSAAASGATIRVTDSLHEESLILVNKQVAIEGMGMEATTIQAASSAAAANSQVFSVIGNVHVTIRDMRIRHGNNTIGGGISSSAYLTVERVHIVGNRVTASGGAIYQQGNLLVVRDSKINFNEATDNTTGSGGGVMAQNAAVLIVESEISNNSAGFGGGGIYLEGSSTVGVYRSQIAANSAPQGDGLMVQRSEGNAHVVNSTISNNEEGIRNFGTIELANVTLADNLFNGSGSSLVNFGEVYVRNTILANAAGGTACSGSTAPIAFDTNLSNDATCGSFVTTVADLELLPPGMYGGETNVFALDSNSPAIDAGSNCEAYDQRGLERKLGGLCDVGAYEKLYTTVCSTPGVAIPDNDTTGVSDVMTVNTMTGTVNTVDLKIEATHSWVGDLSFLLVHEGTAAVAVDRPGVPATTNGCSEDDIDVLLTDSAEIQVENTCAPSTAPTISGRRLPNNSLNSHFADDPANGSWALTALDSVGDDTGTLDHWCVGVDHFTGESSLDSEPIIDIQIVASQGTIGEGDSFFYIIEVTTSPTIAPGTEAPFDLVLQNPSGTVFTPGSFIVPAGTGYQCGGFNAYGCEDGTVDPGKTYRFYLPLTNGTGGTACTSGGVGLDGYNGADANAVRLERMSAPQCVPASQGSTSPIAPIPLAVNLNAISTAKPNLHIFIILFITTLLCLTGILTQTTPKIDRVGT